ncbi:MAG TPA: glycosyltransferase family 39 protein [Phycisphaerae bacterium]|nr:glycosyltransferase family 39 protein [Phycisphaerae bacterium]
MSATEKKIVPQGGRGLPFSACLVLMVAIYATGLSRGVTRPWTGMHDWNGAFFSQLARNLLRYPASVHHGMGVMAMGDAIPPPEERSLYARHPPALVWMVAAAFAAGGEKEWVARLLPIAASLATLVLFVRLVHRKHGTETAVYAGLIYALMPMTVYFGRMVNHEAICLLLMMATLVAWQMRENSAVGGTRQWAASLCAICLALMIWVDWAGLLFAGLFCAWLVWQWRRRRIGSLPVLIIGGTAVMTSIGMVVFLVYAGFEGRWADLIAMFNARRTTAAKDQLQRVWTHVIQNLSWPVFLLAIAGIGVSIGRRLRSKSPTRSRKRIAVERAKSVGLGVLAVTGLLWVTIFWRQLVIHNYWMFYLGPFIATTAALSMAAWREPLRARSARLAGATTALIVTGMVVFCLIGSRDYFNRVTFPEGLIQACREVHRRTHSGDRVLLFRRPITIEKHGDYQFRNVTMPQHAYYMDRPFDVDRDAGSIFRRAGDYPLYVAPYKNRDYPKAGAVIEALRLRFPHEQVGTEMLFQLSGAAEKRG